MLQHGIGALAQRINGGNGVGNGNGNGNGNSKKK